jgi:hypothetical protein
VLKLREHAHHLEAPAELAYIGVPGRAGRMSGPPTEPGSRRCFAVLGLPTRVRNLRSKQ